MSMNLRHAAALALVGWHLMCPPICSSGWGNGKETSCTYGEYNYDAPLDRWFEPPASGEFNSLRKCEISVAEKSSTVVCKCIATDDPRLKDE
jgi:hypothetical protein